MWRYGHAQYGGCAPSTLSARPSSRVAQRAASHEENVEPKPANREQSDVRTRPVPLIPWLKNRI